LDTIAFRPIGTIRSPFHNKEGMPVQPPGAKGIRGMVEIVPEYTKALKDLDGFSHIILLYHFHESSTCSLTVVPFLHDKPHGVFATRAPNRPNPIGISIVELERIENNIIHVINVDILDGTPLLDIKPYIPEFDHQEKTRSGWLAESTDTVYDTRSDKRFG
jgi:tRNA-Thr(GGU) m(6)t(6)A37 methyltransferase TsaA